MIQNQPVTFLSIVRGQYDPNTGSYTKDKVRKTTLYCNITPLSAEQSFKVFGEFIPSGFVIRLTNKLWDSFQKVEINGERYNIHSITESLGRTSVIVNKEID